MSALSITALEGIGEVRAGDFIIQHLLDGLRATALDLADGDVVIVTSKVVSKAEGRVVPCDGSDEAKQALIESQSRRIIRRRGTLRITETHHGFICANAGIDLSNTDAGTAVLLPLDPDKSARRLRHDIARELGRDVAVVITDTFGRSWRHGVTDIALGCAGIIPVVDLRGTTDAYGRVLEATEVAVVDEIAGAADLVLGKASHSPIAVMRGLRREFFGEGSISERVARRAHDDMFR
jgi:coenzyme F420-0:L-glutamate ligase/coenzyme F420-1:gamma-L-glutamate ligase